MNKSLYGERNLNKVNPKRLRLLVPSEMETVCDTLKGKETLSFELFCCFLIRK